MIVRRERGVDIEAAARHDATVPCGSEVPELIFNNFSMKTGLDSGQMFTSILHISH